MSNITYKLDISRMVVEVRDHEQQMTNGFFDEPVLIEISLEEFRRISAACSAALSVMERER